MRKFDVMINNELNKLRKFDVMIDIEFKKLYSTHKSQRFRK